MKKTKTQKGITLVALIITIVVLLILAVVTVTTMQNYGIIDNANEVGKKWNGAVEGEQGFLESANSTLDQYLNGGTTGGSGGITGGQGREGQTVKYDSNNDGKKEDWIILTDRNGLVEIVSAQPMGSLTLGYEDTSVKVTTDLDGDGTVGNEMDIAIASYNNAITTINNYCKTLVTAKDNDGVRSIGETDNNFTPYSSEEYDNCDKKATVDVASGEDYYRVDLEKMQELGIALTGKEYWLATRSVSEGYFGDDNTFQFGVGLIFELGFTYARIVECWGL